MNRHLLSRSVHSRVIYAGTTASATTTIDSAFIDMAGFEGLMIEGSLEATATDNGMEILCSTDSTTTNAEEILDSRAVATSTAILIDVHPWPVGKRYAFARVIRTTTSKIGKITALKYGARRMPIDNATSTQVHKTVVLSSTGASTST